MSEICTDREAPPEAYVVAVVYAPGAALLGDVLDSAGEWCRPVIVNGGSEPWSAEDLVTLRGVAHHVDAARLDGVRLRRQLLAQGVTGVTTFADDLVPMAARIAAELGLTCYHSPATATALTRKDVQRRRLAGTVSGRARFVAFGDAADARRAAAEVGFPAVLKPICGNGSANVFAVDDEAQLLAALRAAERTGRRSDEPRWQLEQRFGGGAHPAAAWLGDYVSVETVALGEGNYWHFCVSDRLPLTHPLREGGMLLPSLLPEQVRDEVCAAATEALTALRVSTGVTHTEVKLTPEGPRIIEVNGRLGGFVNPLLSRVSGLDPVALALRSAAGVARRENAPTFTGNALAMMVYPPAGAIRLVSAADPLALRAIPGVYRIDQHVSESEPVDYRTGTMGRVATVWIEGADADGLSDSYQQVLAVLREGNVYEAPLGGVADGAEITEAAR